MHRRCRRSGAPSRVEEIAGVAVESRALRRTRRLRCQRKVLSLVTDVEVAALAGRSSPPGLHVAGAGRARPRKEEQGREAAARQRNGKETEEQ